LKKSSPRHEFPLCPHRIGPERGRDIGASRVSVAMRVHSCVPLHLGATTAVPQKSNLGLATGALSADNSLPVGLQRPDPHNCSYFSESETTIRTSQRFRQQSGAAIEISGIRGAFDP